MKRKSVILLASLLVCMGLVLAQVALAKEMPQKITISGGDLTEQIEIIDDIPMLEALMSMSLEDYTTRTSQAPEGIGSENYLISRFILNADGDYELLDTSHYYPNPHSENEGGFLYFEGHLYPPSEWDNQWYTPNPENEAILLALIDAQESKAAFARTSLFLTVFRAIAAYFVA